MSGGERVGLRGHQVARRHTEVEEFATSEPAVARAEAARVAPTPRSEPAVAPTPRNEPAVAPTPRSEPAVAPSARNEPAVAPTPRNEPAVPPSARSEPAPAVVRPPTPRAPHRLRSSEVDARTLFAELRAAEPESRPWLALREELVRRHLPLAHFLVRRFAGRGEPVDDLLQVAMIGMLKAIDRFDIERGVEFSTYATPTVVGEVKRHFRDRGWAMKVPRKVQEQTVAVSRATSVLFAKLSRSPTVAEIAAHCSLTEEQVIEAMDSTHAYSTVSLDAELDGGPAAGPSHPAAVDAQIAMESVEHRASLRPLLNKLGERERQIVLLRFFANLTQSEIAAEVGVSQMHVSRLLSRTLARLREGLGDAQ